MTKLRRHARFSQGEITAEFDNLTLGELAAEKAHKPYRHKYPEGISASCTKGIHACWKVNCSCKCHRRGGK